MKTRIFSLLFALLLVFSLTSCKDPEAPADPGAPLDVRIYTLNGTTGFGIAKLMSDAKNGAYPSINYSIEIKTEASDVLAALVNGSVDIAALPTNAASTVYNKTNGGVEILAVNTLGCLYLTNTTGAKVNSIADLGGKTVYAPAQNPTFIFTYLCQQNGLTVITNGTPAANEVYIDSTSYAQPAALRDAVASGSVGLAVLPEPMVTIAVNKGAAASPAVAISVDLDLTAAWDQIPGKAGTLVQGCIVVRREFLQAHPEAVASFLAAYEQSISFLNANPTEAAKLIYSLGIFKDPKQSEESNLATIASAIPRCNVRYIAGADMKTAVSTYLAILAGINPQSIGGKLPTEDFYHIAA